MTFSGIGQYVDPLIKPLADAEFGDINWKSIKIGSRGKEAILSLLRDRHAPKTLCILCPKQSDARALFNDLLDYLGDTTELLFLPDADVLPYERLVVDSRTTNERITTLSQLAKQPKHLIVVASVGAALRKTLSPDTFDKDALGFLNITPGQDLISTHAFLERLVDMGYKNVTMVEAPGTFSSRGGIIDLYSPNHSYPLRIDLWDTEIESIRYFDVNTQRSVQDIDSDVSIIVSSEQLQAAINEDIFAAKIKELNYSDCNRDIADRIRQDLEILQEVSDPESFEFYNGFFNDSTLFDYLNQDSVLVFDRQNLIKEEAKLILEKIEKISSSRCERGDLPRGFVSPIASFEQAIIPDESINLDTYGVDESNNLFGPPKQYAGNLEEFIADVTDIGSAHTNVIVTRQSFSRIKSLLESSDANNYHSLEGVTDYCLEPGQCYLLERDLSLGWNAKLTASSELRIYTDFEIFGVSRSSGNWQSANEKRQTGYKSLEDLDVGSYVVHIDHGISKFTGLTTMGSFSDKEYLVLEYAQEDKLYVPTDQLHRVSPFVGSSDQAPSLTRLGTSEWSRLKDKVKESAQELAKELLDVQADREAHAGIAYPEDTLWQEEFEQSFLYTETQDQLTAIKEVKEDMQLRKPMDRLVCGDVGYGKTEVALRAAFKAIAEGMQVAVLVPTTVLAQQHFNTFSERLGPYSMKVDSLSRFKSRKEQTEVLSGMKDGSIDLVVGTHRLLQSDISFKNLGLIVVDEEQRFGVMHKEMLKKLRTSVDIVSISATPIPRTLNMALSGIKDMSIIYTAPELRLPVKTFASEYSEEVIIDAVMREVEREGQVFYLHNRVKTMPDVVNRLSELMPNVRITYAHGRMPEEELESVMVQFANRDSDVLVCTTIIESGIDLPNVNTLILDRADRFGLSQMYQLRGRVGRGERRAYAYLMVPKGRNITENAERRIEAIMEASDLGAGFMIAMRDLEIRGAGNILGSAQSGHIKSVGLELYSQILNQAVEEIKPDQEPLNTTSDNFGQDLAIIDLPIAAFIPDGYISHLPSKLGIYHRLSKAKDESDVTDMKEELIDRYGDLPEEVSELLNLINVRNYASSLGVKTVNNSDGSLLIGFSEDFGGARLALQKAIGPTVDVRGSSIRVPLKSTADLLPTLDNILTRYKVFRNRLERMV
ncbi:MAG: transcription-repair coupling factor [Dehalococcoidia bacterium]